MRAVLKTHARGLDLLDQGQPRTHLLTQVVLTPANSAGESNQQLSREARAKMLAGRTHDVCAPDALLLLIHSVRRAPRLRA